MRNEAPSLAPRRGPNGRFTSGVQEKIQQPAENDDVELLDLTDEEMVEEEPIAPKKPSPPKITEAQLKAADERRRAAQTKDKKAVKDLKKNIDKYDPMDPTWVAVLDAADPQRVAERRAARLKKEVEALDPMDSRRIAYAFNDPMHPAHLAARDAAEPQGSADKRLADREASRLKKEVEALDPMDSRRIAYAFNDPMHPAHLAARDAAEPQRIADRRKKNFEQAVEQLDPMDPRRIRHTFNRARSNQIDETGNEERTHPKQEYKALLAENKILEYINTLKSEYAARYGADLDKVSRGHETIGESFRAWRRDIRPLQGLKAMLKGAGSLFKKASLEETLKDARAAKETKEYYLEEYDQAQAELAQSRNARRLGKQPRVSERYYEE